MGYRCQGTVKLRGSPNGAGKAAGLGQPCASPCCKTQGGCRDTSCPVLITTSMAGMSLAAETGAPKVPCQRRYPKNAPAKQQLLLAAGSVSHKRAGALHTHYPDAIHTLPSKAQG